MSDTNQMSEGKHTAGSWHWSLETITKGIDSRGKQKHVMLSNDKRQSVLHPSWANYEGEIWQAWVTIKPEDANLIAAAPSLLEALKEAEAALLCKWCVVPGTLDKPASAPTSGCGCAGCKAALKSRAAIAQAEKGAGE